jgi:geranylgeranyl pyrophosphate synthase
MSSGNETSQDNGERIRRILIKKSAQALSLAREAILSERIRSSEARSALRYYVANWREAIHPGLIDFVSEAAQGDSGEVLDLQVSMLLFSAAIDVHDDIIDNSTQKHGTPTVFGKFGRDMAILLGNAFMIKGFILLFEAVEKLPHRMKNEILKTVKCALFEVGDAHACELRLKHRWDADPAEYLEILEKKGAIIEAEARIGALVGGGTRQVIDALSRYGRILGLLGTLREEFVDMFEVQEMQNRIQNECLPIPVMYALQDMSARDKILKIFSKGRIAEKDLEEAIGTVSETRTVKALKRKMSEEIEEAVNLLLKLEKTEARLFLATLIKSMLENL